MEVLEERSDDLVVLALSGDVDARGAKDLQRKLESLLDAGIRRFVVDFSGAGRLAGPGLRALIAFGNRLQGKGGLQLCSLGEAAKSVIEISGLGRSFAIAPTRAEAIANLRSSPRVSAVATTVTKVMGAEPLGRRVESHPEPSRLARLVERTLAPSEAKGPRK